jgi:hypothetical protein
MRNKEIKFDLAELLLAFDEVLPMTDEEKGIYWLRSTRPDSIIIILCFSVYEMSANVIVRCNPQVVCSSVEMARCTSIKVLEAEKRCLEIISEGTASNLRCVLCLTGENILEVR